MLALSRHAVSVVGIGVADVSETCALGCHEGATLERPRQLVRLQFARGDCCALALRRGASALIVKGRSLDRGASTFLFSERTLNSCFGPHQLFARCLRRVVDICDPAVGCPFVLVGQPLPLVGQLFALVGEPLPLGTQSLPLVGRIVPLCRFSGAAPVVRRLSHRDSSASMMNTVSSSSNRNTRNGKPRTAPSTTSQPNPCACVRASKTALTAAASMKDTAPRSSRTSAATLSAQSFDVNGDVAAVGEVDLAGQREHDGGRRALAAVIGAQATANGVGTEVPDTGRDNIKRQRFCETAGWLINRERHPPTM